MSEFQNRPTQSGGHGFDSAGVLYRDHTFRSKDQEYYAVMDAINRRLENVERIVPAFESIASDLRKAMPQIEQMHSFYTHGREHLATKLDVSNEGRKIVKDLSDEIAARPKTTTLLWILAFIAAVAAIPTDFYGRVWSYVHPLSTKTKSDVQPQAPPVPETPPAGK